MLRDEDETLRIITYPTLKKATYTDNRGAIKTDTDKIAADLDIPCKVNQSFYFFTMDEDFCFFLFHLHSIFYKVDNLP